MLAIQAKEHYCSPFTVLNTCCVRSGVVWLKCVPNTMLMKEGNDVVSQDVIPVVNGINSGDNLLHAYATPWFDHQHSLNGNRIRQKIAYHANVIITNDHTFLPNVSAHFRVDQDRSDIRSVGEHVAQRSEHSDTRCLHWTLSSTLNSWRSPGNWQRSKTNMEANNMASFL